MEWIAPRRASDENIQTSVPFRSLFIFARLRERVTTGRVRDGLGGCYRSNGYVFSFSFFSALVDGNCNVWARQMIIPRSTTFIRKVSTSTKKTVSSAASYWTLPRQLYIFMWSTLIHKLNYQRWEVRRWTETSICGNIWLPTASWYQPLPIWSEHQTQINWAALWSHILEWCKCGYGSKIERVRMHS